MSRSLPWEAYFWLSMFFSFGLELIKSFNGCIGKIIEGNMRNKAQEDPELIELRIQIKALELERDNWKQSHSFLKKLRQKDILDYERLWWIAGAAIAIEIIELLILFLTRSQH